MSEFVNSTLKTGEATDAAPTTALIDGGVRVGGFGWNSGYRNAGSGLFGGDILSAPTIRSAVGEILPARRQAVANSRDVDRNHGPMKAGISKRSVAMVGAQIRLQSLPNWKALGLTPEWAAEFASNFENEFSLWGDDVRCLNDAERHYQFGGQMLLAARNACGADGECALILRYDENRQREYGARYATFLEVLDPDRIETPVDRQDEEGRTIIAGRRLDPWGAYTGFYVRVGHPSDSRTDQPRWEFVPREANGRPMGIHWFFKQRAAAQRGMPSIIASLRQVKMLDRFDDATLQAAVINAILSIYVQTDSGSDDVLKRLQTQAPTGKSSADMEALWDFRFDLYDKLNLRADGVRIPVLPFGDKIEMATANRAADDTKSFRDAFSRAMAAELGLSFEQFTGDYSETTYAGARAGLIDNWRLVTADRHLFTQATASLVAMSVLEEAIMTGKIKLPPGAPDFWENMTAYSQCNFMGPGMGWVDPLNEIKAAQMRIQEGLSSRTYEASLQGQDHRDVIDQQAADDAYAALRGVKLGPPAPTTPVGDEEEEDEKRRRPGAAGGGNEEAEES